MLYLTMFQIREILGGKTIMKIKMFMLGVTAAVVLAACGEGAVMESSKAEETTAAVASSGGDGTVKQCGRGFGIGEQHCRGNDSGSFADHHRSSDRSQ